MPDNKVSSIKYKVLSIYSKKGLRPVFSKLSQSKFSTLTSQLSPLNSESGFTLLELMVVITIVGLIGVGLIYNLDPFGQIAKGKDAERRQDLQQVKNALEAYYQDNNCYPQTINFGAEWEENGTVYMTQVPQDSTCSQLDGYCYEYITDPAPADNCSQWNVVFARLSQIPSQTTTICPLSELDTSCVPSGYDENWACTMSGAVNCSLISLTGFSYNVGVGGIGEDPLPSPTPTPPAATPTLPAGAVTYNLGGGANNDPYMQTMTIYPLWPDPDGPQTLTLYAVDDVADINQVQVHLFSDDPTPQLLTLSHSTGTLRDGTWSGTIQSETYNDRFTMAITALDVNNNVVCTVLTPKGNGAEADEICDGILNP